MRLFWMVCAVQFLVPVAAQAEWQIKPFLGVTFGGETTFVDLEQAAGRRNVSVGVNGTWLGNVFGFEGDLAHGPGFFENGDQELVVGSSVTTLTGNILIAVPREMSRYTLRPYLVAGAGLMQVRIDDFFGSLRVRETLPAMDIGGGATGFLSDHVGVSWDVRYFRSLGGSNSQGVSIGKEELSFWRAMMAVAIRLQRDVP
jgi:hypothetical protein